MRILVAMILVVGMFSMTAFAAETDSVAIVVLSDNTNTTAATYTRAQLSNEYLFDTIDKYNYSAVTKGGAYQYYTAKGPELEEIFTKALAALTGSAITLSDVGPIDIVGFDGYKFSTTKGFLLDTTRYWYDEGLVWQDEVPAILATAVAFFIFTRRS